MSVLRAAGWMLSMLASTGLVARDLNQDEALRLRQSGAILPLESLLDKALAGYPGGVLLEAELEQEHGGYRYEFEILLPDGRVRELEFNAVTGDLLEDKDDD
ncbi:PepSY domain-containing protein [Pseudomonas massiliensis]|uniref:PepSY domain-containing protein n=1 Tax=Pseudomonas massiliensis TaxID=522492 RepID=UPI000A832AA2